MVLVVKKNMIAQKIILLILINNGMIMNVVLAIRVALLVVTVATMVIVMEVLAF